MDISELLYSFNPITLAEMDSVKLLDRTDTKFIFRYDRLPGILNGLFRHYKILDVNGVKQNRYETLYFDTADFKLYFDHHNGRTNRYKVRYRKYVDSDLVFFEVKFKNNRGRTIKYRIKRSAIKEVIEGKAAVLLSEKTPLKAETMQSKLWVNYSRITLVNKTSTERLTLDLGLHFKDERQVYGYGNLVVAEVKQEKTGASPFINLMRLHHIRDGSISKYCFGVMSLVAEIKRNNFKPHLLAVNKMNNGNNFQVAA